MTTTKSKCPTLATVAEHVGVSRMTVSNAFNRPDQLSPALRERVLLAARELGYGGPDPAARALASGRSGSLGLVFDYSLTAALTDPATAGLLLGVARECESRSLGLTLVPLLEGADDTHVRTALVDGFVLYSVTRNDARLRAVRERHLPYVLVDHEPADGAQRVNIDDRGAARAMAEHLLGLGHRDIALVMGWEHRARTLGQAQADSIYFVGGERLAGWREAGLERDGHRGERPRPRPRDRPRRGPSPARPPRPADRGARLLRPACARRDGRRRRAWRRRPGPALSGRLRRHRRGGAGGPDHDPPTARREGRRRGPAPPRPR